MSPLKLLLCLMVELWLSVQVYSQTYPSYGPEEEVTISGLTFDAMEPFLSPDASYLLFNSLNDGINTKLYYSTRINDSTFAFEGEMVGANQIAPPHLDAVPDLDSNSNFYWTSTRDYPAEFDNLFHGKFDHGNVTNIGRIRGDFYIYTPGWLIMDHGISYDGNQLYFNNARFDNINCTGPCETKIGIAEKVNDSTFAVVSNSEEILQNINDPAYIYYAPCISRDNLELFFTRFEKGTVTIDTRVEICVAVRNVDGDPFSEPRILFSESIGNIVEAPTLTPDKSLMYYHKKVDGIHKIMYRRREVITGFDHEAAIPTLVFMPNPMSSKTIIKIENGVGGIISIRIINNLGKEIASYNLNSEQQQILLNKGILNKGVYYVQLRSREKLLVVKKLLIE